MCPRAEEFFREITALVEREAAEQANRKAAASALSNITIKPPSAFHDNPRYGSDLHRADLAWAIYAASRGFSEQQIRMRFFMPEISQKKGRASRQLDYAERTATKAIRIAQPMC
jgi:hypothetical protein